jgi:hypothetical protein
MRCGENYSVLSFYILFWLLQNNGGFGDMDGACVIPYQAEKEVFTKALEKARGEKTVSKAIQNGMSAVQAFKKYGIM